MFSVSGLRAAAAWHKSISAVSSAVRVPSFSPFPLVNRSLSSRVEYPVVDAEKEKEYAAELEDVRQAKERKAAIRNALVGKVVSTKAQKSITVLVSYHKLIPKYNARIQRRKKIMAHDEAEVCDTGDVVRIHPCRPYSKKKRFILQEVLIKAKKLD